MDTFTIQLLDSVGGLLMILGIIGGLLMMGVQYIERRTSVKSILPGPYFDRLFILYMVTMSVSSGLWAVAGFGQSNLFKGFALTLVALGWAIWATYKWSTRRAFN